MRQQVKNRIVTQGHFISLCLLCSFCFSLRKMPFRNQTLTFYVKVEDHSLLCIDLSTKFNQHACQPYVLWLLPLGVTTERWVSQVVCLGYTYPPPGKSIPQYTRHTVYPPPQKGLGPGRPTPANRHTLVKTLPSCKFVGGR